MAEITLVETGWDGEPRPNARRHSILSAVEYECTPDGYSHEGQLERTQAHVDKAVEMMGRLLTALHEKGLLDNKTVLTVIGGRFAVEETV